MSRFDSSPSPASCLETPVLIRSRVYVPTLPGHAWLQRLWNPPDARVPDAIVYPVVELHSSPIETGSFGSARRVRDPPDGASGESQENFRFQIDRSLAPFRRPIPVTQATVARPSGRGARRHSQNRAGQFSEKRVSWPYPIGRTRPPGGRPSRTDPEAPPCLAWNGPGPGGRTAWMGVSSWLSLHWQTCRGTFPPRPA